MDERFDQEFYTSEWQRVLPLGPGGIQPYVGASRAKRWPGGPADLDRLIAALGAAARGVIGFGRFAAIGVAKRPMVLASAPRAPRQRPSRGLGHQAARPVVRRAVATRRSDAA